jgi:hypothetical protein
LLIRFGDYEPALRATLFIEEALDDGAVPEHSANYFVSWYFF